MVRSRSKLVLQARLDNQIIMNQERGRLKSDLKIWQKTGFSSVRNKSALGAGEIMQQSPKINKLLDDISKVGKRNATTKTIS